MTDTLELMAQIADRLEPGYIDTTARKAVQSLSTWGSVALNLTPGDMTSYIVTIVDTQCADGQTNTIGSHFGARFVFASSFGPAYAWRGSEMHPNYVTEKWVANGHEHTGAVFTLFMNAVAIEMTRIGMHDDA